MFVAAGTLSLDRDTARAADDAELRDVLRANEARRRELDRADAIALGELDARGSTDRDFGVKTATWLARETGIPALVAKKRVRVAAMLRRWLPEVDVAWAEGRIGWDHARVFTEIADPRILFAVADLQTTFLELAEGVGFDRWAREVRGLAELLDQDGGHDPNRDLERNELSYTRTTDGVTHLRGMLVGELGLTFEQALAAETDVVARQFARDHEKCSEIEIPGRATLQALALNELIRRGLGLDLASSKPPATEVALRVEASDPTVITDPDGVRVQDGSLRTLRCGADLYAIVVDSLGVPLDLGRRVRYADEYQRRALRERDGGCIFPGCDAPARWCDVHHQVEWDHGGHTNVAHLALLCRRHHRVTHRRGWRLDVTTDQWFYWTTANGHRFWSQRHGRQRQGPEPPDPPDKRPPSPPTCQH